MFHQIDQVADLAIAAVLGVVDDKRDIQMRIFTVQAVDYRDGGIGGRRYAEQKLEVWMRLFAEGPQIGVEARLGAAERLEDADGLARVRRFKTRTISPGKKTVAHEGGDSDIAGGKTAQDDDRKLDEKAAMSGSCRSSVLGGA
jgi:hypothetical protein